MSKELKIKGSLSKDYQQIYIDDEPIGVYLNEEGKVKLKDIVVSGELKASQEALVIKNNSDGNGSDIKTDGSLTLDPDGDLIVSGANLQIDATKALYLDGGTDTYIVEASNDVMKNKNSTIKKPDGSYYKAFENGIYYPYLDVKNKLTIGIGHNISKSKIDYSGGITPEQADNLLQKDINNSLRKSKIFYDDKYGDGEFDKLPMSEQFMLSDYTFNLGRLSKFPNFTEAIRKKDTDYALEQYKRYAEYDDGTVEELGRNKDFLEAYLIPWINKTKFGDEKGIPYINANE